MVKICANAIIYARSKYQNYRKIIIDIVIRQPQTVAGEEIVSNQLVHLKVPRKRHYICKVENFLSI